ncbi:hypothetical protein ABZ504_43025, partial [Streptomyces mirabilis]|uniref:hypothetical protein n=1 Tax=Streptomyces mirabilis TaxID=68239 RepID=UPI0033E7CC0F
IVVRRLTLRETHEQTNETLTRRSHKHLSSHVLWNPWFILGGVLFGLAARSFGKGMTGEVELRSITAH